MEPELWDDVPKGMGSFIDRAMDWRHRAEELRRLAERMMTPATRGLLLDRAASLDHHAENLEQTALKFSRARQRATRINPFEMFLRCGGPGREPSR